MLQCVAVCCSVLQCLAVCCMWGLQIYCGMLQCVAVCCSVLQCVAVCCSMLQCVAMCGSGSQGRLGLCALSLLVFIYLSQILKSLFTCKGLFANTQV